MLQKIVVAIDRLICEKLKIESNHSLPFQAKTTPQIFLFKKKSVRKKIQVQRELVPSTHQPHLQSCFHSYGESGMTDQFGGIIATWSCL